MIGLELTSNFAKTVLASPINASATTITLFPGAGALFPNPSGGNYFRILITDIATSNYNEIVLCTDRSGDVLTVTRNAEGTLARSWLAGDIIENVMTAGAFSELRSQGLNSNTAIGSLSLDSVTTGANNSTIGTYSLQNITTGSGNSTIGYQSARYIANGSTNLTVATNSTYIGTNTKASANNVTNETVIGYNAIGSGSNTITLGGSTVVNTVISSGNVGIGTGAPNTGSKLHLYSSVTANTGILRIQHSLSTYNAGLVCLNANSTNGLNIFVDGAGGSQIIQGDNSYLILGTNNAERMRINSSGNVGIGTTSPNASAILDAQSTTKGVRFPNMTTTQKNSVVTPATGLVVFDTTLAKLCVYSGAAWQTITSA